MDKEPGYSPVSIFAAVCGKAAYFAAKGNHLDPALNIL